MNWYQDAHNQRRIEHPDPRSVWGWWLEFWLVRGWILLLVQHFSLFYAISWVNFASKWLFFIQVGSWQNDLIHVCPCTQLISWSGIQWVETPADWGIIAWNWLSNEIRIDCFFCIKKWFLTCFKSPLNMLQCIAPPVLFVVTSNVWMTLHRIILEV